MNENLIGISNFVKRQTPESEFTHFDGTWEELTELVKIYYLDAISHQDNPKFLLKKGYREGVFVLSLNNDDVKRFYTYTDYPMVIGMKLKGEYKYVAGREHEPPKWIVVPDAPKAVCRYVDIILYSKEVLAEDHDDTTGCDFEIVSINGRLKDEPAPMDPMTIVRNWKHLKGGTKMEGAKPEEVLEMLCQSIMYKNGIREN